MSHSYFWKYFMWIFSYHWPNASENLLYQGNKPNNLFVCATHPSFPRSLPFLPFPLKNDRTGLDVRDSTTAEQQPDWGPETDVRVASLWKAATSNGTEKRFSAPAGSEAGFSVFAGRCLALRVCAHMRLAVPDPCTVALATASLVHQFLVTLSCLCNSADLTVTNSHSQTSLCRSIEEPV